MHSLSEERPRTRVYLENSPKVPEPAADKIAGVNRASAARGAALCFITPVTESS
jgi:hypothetical protein